jgi:multicomponent Na+:H+ antiporter subunit G
VIGELLALVGAVLILVSATGVVRFGDVFARLHALAKASTLGVLLLLAGLLHLLASPPASNMLSRATYLVTPLPAGAIDERRDPGPSEREGRPDPGG